MGEWTKALEELYQCTIHIQHSIDKLDTNMENNEDVWFEQLQQEIDKRERIIEQLKLLKENHSNPHWTKEEQQKLEELGKMEQAFQRRMVLLHQAYAKQFEKLQQGKKTAKGYQWGYGEQFVDGTYIDKRK